MNSDASEHSEERDQPERGVGEAASGCSLPGLSKPFPKPRSPEAPESFRRVRYLGSKSSAALPHCRPPWHWKAALLTPPHPFLAPHPSSAAGGTEERRSYSSAEPVSLGRELLSAALLVLAPPDSRVSQEGPPPQGGSSSPGDEESQRVGRLCVPVYSGIIRKELLL